MASDTDPGDPMRPSLALSEHHDAPVEDADADLVRRAQGGDRTAFGVLFKKHHGRVQAMCTRMLADAAEVEDAVQQAWLEAWRCLPTFEGRARFTTWITRVAIHTCFSTRRRLR